MSNLLENEDVLARKNKRTGLFVLVTVFVMVGLSFAFVPIYDALCRVTGWGGTTQVSMALPLADDIIDRNITVRFDSNVAPDLPWVFQPEMLKTSVRLGERGFTNFYAYNKLSKPVTGTALFNVTPLKAGKYFHKVQCFCFDEQTLGPRERVNMPVLFFVDPAMNDDPDMDDVSVITLSYTFYKAGSEKLDRGLASFYEDGPLMGQ